MSLRQTWFVIVLTVLYLCVELAFNARLLDVVGSGAPAQQVHAMEVFGRTLSGVAVALVVLQLFLARRNRSLSGRPGTLATVFWCAVAGLAVFGSLNLLVDRLVDKSQPAFRKVSLNIVLLQRALVRGEVVLDGMNNDPALFSKPAGKAFLGLFPLMAVSIDKLDEKIRDVKLELISRTVAEKAGGTAGYYRDYEKASKETRQQWQRYQGIPDAGQVDDEINRRHADAWNDYLTSLGKRGWSPSTVPPRYQAAVRNNVRRKVPVPAGWDLTDQDAFRSAVAKKVRGRMPTGDGSIVVDGRRIEAGLGWPAFYAHAAIQARLRHALGLPTGTRLLAAYESAGDFKQGVFDPMIRQQARARLAQYDAPEGTYADGAANAALGLESTRAIIVPPLALFFSLMGAIFHIAKLCFLLTLLLAHAVPSLRARARHLWLAPVAVLCTLIVVLSVTDNAVTGSRLYAYMCGQVLASGKADASSALQAQLLVRALHVVAVGQDYGYPANELVRTNVLGGFNFGFKNENK